MNKDKEEGLRKLKEVLKEYNLSIRFTCSDCSDTYGLYEDKMVIDQGDETILEVHCWAIDHTDL